MLSDKSMSIIKGLNKQSKDKAKATNKINIPTQGITPNQKADITQKETAPQQEYKPSLAELQAAIKI